MIPMIPMRTAQNYEPRRNCSSNLDSFSKRLKRDYNLLYNAFVNNDEEESLKILYNKNAFYLPFNNSSVDTGDTAFIVACDNKMIKPIKIFNPNGTEVKPPLKCPLWGDIKVQGCNIIIMLINIYKSRLDDIKESNSQCIFKYNKININKQNNRGVNGLMYICYHGLVEELKHIITCSNLDVNLQNEIGSTAIILACQTKKEECIKILLSLPNINIALKEKDGKDMFHYITPETLLSLKDLIIPLVIKQYYNNKYPIPQKVQDLINSSPNIKNQFNLTINNLHIRSIKSDLNKYRFTFSPSSVKKSYSNSILNLSNKIKIILEKLIIVSESNINKKEMIRFIYNIVLHHKLIDIKNIIESSYKNIIN